MSLLKYELEEEGEEELEGEELLGLIPRLSPQLLQRVAPAAARAAAAGMRTVGRADYEGEEELEGERVLSPIRRVYPDAMMEHFGHAAAEAESEAEAEAFIGALIPLAARLAPRVAPVIMRAAPGLIRGLAGVTRTLRANPSTRPLVRAVPTIVRRTTADLTRQAAGGRPVTPQQAVRTLARQTNRALASPQQAGRALQRNAAIDRRYHQVAQGCGCWAE
jgi:hypothetical protein